MDKPDTVASGKIESTIQGDEKKAPPRMMPITMDKRGELVGPVVAVLLGVFMLIETRTFRKGMIPDMITSKGLPNITAILFIIGGIIQAYRQIRTWPTIPGNFLPEEGQEDEKGYPASAVRAISVILVSFLWAWLLKPLGFLISTPLCLSAALLIMGVHSWVKNILFSIIFSVANWYIFGPLLGIRFPLGPLEDLALSLGLIM
jgi:putative tricarboxylic transport membrane protein